MNKKGNIGKMIVWVAMSIMLFSMNTVYGIDGSSYPFAGGSGTIDDPYQIETIEQLEAVQYYKDYNFILMNDLSFTKSDFEEGGQYYNNGLGWNPIGKSFEDAYMGIFDGNGYEISGIQINGKVDSAGLFGYVKGVIKNLGVTDFQYNISEGLQCGGIAGYLRGTIVNCYSTNGEIYINNLDYCDVGGIVGVLNFGGKIKYCYNSSNIVSENRAGGIVGTVGGNRGSIIQSYNTGNIKGNETGGIIGASYGVYMYDCYNTGNVSGTEYAGGAYGSTGNSNTIVNFYNIGVIDGLTNVGNLSGSSSAGSKENCYCNQLVKKGWGVSGKLIDISNFDDSYYFEGFDFENVWEMSETKPVLKHDFQKKVEHELSKYDAVEATCTTSGNNEYYICENCNIVFKEDMITITTVDNEIISAKGHNLRKFEANEATCVEQGNKEYYICENCSIVYRADKVTETLVKYEIIPALGHEYETEWTIDKEATCIEEGSKSHHCTRCDDKIDITIISKKEHTWNDGVVTKEPTCIQPGEITYTCEICGETKIDINPALGHDYETEWTIDKEATCIEEGSKSHHCTRCDDKIDITIISKKEHTWNDGVVTKVPTCTQSGEITYTCETCDETRTETISASHNLLHVEAKEATLSENGNIEYWYCEVCSKYYLDKNATIEISEKDTIIYRVPFKDVFKDAWYYEPIIYVYDRGMMSGYDGYFTPEENMTRSMIVSTLYRLDGSPEVTDFTATSIFGDVYSGAWFETAVNWSYNEGISVGYPDIMQFGVNDSVTREQLAALLYRYAEKNGYDVSAREDLTEYIGYGEISEYAKDSMSWAVSVGVISGIRSEVDGVVTYDLAPKGYATRAQLASILMRFCDYYEL